MSEPDDSNAPPRENPPRLANGRFPKGYVPPVRRRKGSKNKIPKSVKEAINRAAMEVGGGDLTEFFAQLGRMKLEALAAHVVHANVPKATTEESAASAGCINTLVVVSVPRGASYCSSSGKIVYPDGSTAEPPPFVPYAPTPDYCDPAPGATESVVVGRPVLVVDNDDGGDEPPAA
jgi:hypothetical protein